MVMHARKISRLNDGFSEKPPSHGYESFNKYKQFRYGVHEKSRESPSTNSLRSSSPDSHSPRYPKNNYYKVRERDVRERDYKQYRDKADNSRSPKERRRDREHRELTRERERDHRESRSSHDRNHSVHKKDEKERMNRVGDWSEHVSSSGKKYYYNCRTEVSQWEKPTEWLDWERNHRSSTSQVHANHNSKESNSSLSHRSHEKNKQEKHSRSLENYRENSRDFDRERKELKRDSYYEKRDSRKHNAVEVETADMDISSESSSPTSENLNHHQSLDLNPSTSNHSAKSLSNFVKPSPAGPMPKGSINILASLASSLPCTSSSNSNSHQIISGLMSGTNSVFSNLTSVPQLLNTHPRLRTLSGNYSADSNLNGNSMPQENKIKLEPLNISTDSNLGPGPPTPTHSENQDVSSVKKGNSPTNNSLNCLQSLSQNSLHTTTLTPSLANYYKERLIAHVQSWPAEAHEKQCQRLSEEAHTVGSLITTKVSADLKMARSLVRLAEIQATLHEQRILFLQAQKRELEEVKSQYSFMNEG